MIKEQEPLTAELSLLPLPSRCLDDWNEPPCLGLNPGLWGMGFACPPTQRLCLLSLSTKAATSFSVRKTLPRGCPSDWVQDSDVLTGYDHTGAASSSSTLVDSTWIFRLRRRLLPQVDRRGQHGGRAGEGSLAGTGLWMATPWPGTLSSHQSSPVAKIPCQGEM